MNQTGLRKAALYLASLAPRDRQALITALPVDAGRALRPLIAQVIRHGWHLPGLAGLALTEEMHGQTSPNTVPVDALLKLSKLLPPDWSARVIATNPALDPKFFLALLDAPIAGRIRTELERVSRLPERLREAILQEAACSLPASSTA